MIHIQKRYRDDLEEIDESEVDRIEMTLVTYKKVCCGHKKKKIVDIGWISEPKDLQLSNVKEYSIEDRTLSLLIEI
ncbi:hypothetical protein [Methanococcoides methylutens]|uniref:Uncharacterized protein n=1 Tax=Methanococcoides methylutens MM1 TaxID=1434104 RepID=A0A0E3WZV5_METMT|nr:hypothetical protein [Methanococcoides methylutens]AKB85194.1 hypothetical protein MCMEM_1141 [Methanococcoides methylutens MM1]